MLTHRGERPHQSLNRAKRVAAACHRCGNAAPKALVHVRCVVNLFNITIAVNYEKKILRCKIFGLVRERWKPWNLAWKYGYKSVTRYLTTMTKHRPFTGNIKHDKWKCCKLHSVQKTPGNNANQHRAKPKMNPLKGQKGSPRPRRVIERFPQQKLEVWQGYSLPNLSNQALDSMMEIDSMLDPTCCKLPSEDNWNNANPQRAKTTSIP